jgi:hypothetical protein
MGAFPKAGNSLAPIELALDSNACSFGCSVVALASGVSINGMFFGGIVGLAAGAVSTIVNSTGFSSSGRRG